MVGIVELGGAAAAGLRELPTRQAHAPTHPPTPPTPASCFPPPLLALRSTGPVRRRVQSPHACSEGTGPSDACSPLKHVITDEVHTAQHTPT